MNESNLSRLLMVVSLATFTGTATLAQQAGGAPQPQLGPNTPGGTPPAEITPSHPLNGTTAPRARSNTTGGTTGSAPRTQGGGESQGNHATDQEKK